MKPYKYCISKDNEDYITVRDTIGRTDIVVTDVITIEFTDAFLILGSGKENMFMSVWSGSFLVKYLLDLELFYNKINNYYIPMFKNAEFYERTYNL